MRTRVGWIVTILGGLCAVLGLVVMIVLGPDSRFTTGPHPVDTDGIAVVTAPGVITWKGVQVDVLAEVPVNKPVFVGIGNSVDVEEYVKDTRRVEVTSFTTPWTLRTRQVDGRGGFSGAPTALDWWIAGSAGLGGARISALLPDETVSAAILSVGASNLQGLEVSYAYGIRGGFAKGGGLVLAGLGLVWGGALVRRGEWFGDEEDDDEGAVVVRRREHAEDDAVEEDEVEEVVYLYVDEDGVEHEISAEEAAGYEVVEVVVEEGDEELPAEVEAAFAEIDDEPDPEADLEADLEPEERPRATTGVLTAADIAAGMDEPPKEKIVYVFVDDDGVEHEVGEDELDAFEVIEDEDGTEGDERT